MNAGIEWAVVPMECSACHQRWTAVVEVNKIEWFDGSTEYSFPFELECPECGLFTETNTDDEGPDS